jgi:hypothetical protein
MAPLPSEIVFRVGCTSHTWRDVLLAAALRGEWIPVVHRVREELACEHRAQSEGNPLAEDALSKAREEFRYAHALVSAEEAESWLKRRGLNVSTWTTALHRKLLRAHWIADLADTRGRFAASDDALADALWPGLVVSGEADRWCAALAERAALSAESPGAPASAAAEIDALLGSDAVAENLWACNLVAFQDRGDEREKVCRLVALEIQQRQSWKREVDARAVAECVAAHCLDWIHYEGYTMSFQVESMAREACLRLRRDGDSMAQVAADAGVPVFDFRCFLEDADPELGAFLVGAVEGELLGPIALENEFALYSVARRVLPSADDETVRQRAAKRIRANRSAEAMYTHVIWSSRG